MLRPYIRPTKAHPEAEQAEALRRVGADMNAVWIEELSRRAARAADPALLEARQSAIRQLRRGDRLAVARLSDLALSQPDFIATMRAVTARGAAVFDAETGTECDWPQEADRATAALQRFLEARERQRTAPARAALAEARRKAGYKPTRLEALSADRKSEARRAWADLSVSGAAVAAEFGVSRRTLLNYFGPRDETVVPRSRKR